MAMLVRLTGARRILEVGTFTGYSALVMAEAMPADGRILCCDLPGDYNAVARRYWQEAGVEDCIDLHLAPPWKPSAAWSRKGSPAAST